MFVIFDWLITLNPFSGAYAMLKALKQEQKV